MRVRRPTNLTQSHYFCPEEWVNITAGYWEKLGQENPKFYLGQIVKTVIWLNIEKMCENIWIWRKKNSLPSLGYLVNRSNLLIPTDPKQERFSVIYYLWMRKIICFYIPFRVLFVCQTNTFRTNVTEWTFSVFNCSCVPWPVSKEQTLKFGII